MSTKNIKEMIDIFKGQSAEEVKEIKENNETSKVIGSQFISDSFSNLLIEDNDTENTEQESNTVISYNDDSISNSTSNIFDSELEEQTDVLEINLDITEVMNNYNDNDTTEEEPVEINNPLLGQDEEPEVKMNTTTYEVKGVQSNLNKAMEVLLEKDLLKDVDDVHANTNDTNTDTNTNISSDTISDTISYVDKEDEENESLEQTAYNEIYGKGSSENTDTEKEQEPSSSQQQATSPMADVINSIDTNTTTSELNDMVSDIEDLVVTMDEADSKLDEIKTTSYIQPIETTIQDIQQSSEEVQEQKEQPIQSTAEENTEEQSQDEFNVVDIKEDDNINQPSQPIQEEQTTSDNDNGDNTNQTPSEEVNKDEDEDTVSVLLIVDVDKVHDDDEEEETVTDEVDKEETVTDEVDENQITFDNLNQILAEEVTENETEDIASEEVNNIDNIEEQQETEHSNISSEEIKAQLPKNTHSKALPNKRVIYISNCKKETLEDNDIVNELYIIQNLTENILSSGENYFSLDINDSRNVQNIQTKDIIRYNINDTTIYQYKHLPTHLLNHKTRINFVNSYLNHIDNVVDNYKATDDFFIINKYSKKGFKILTNPEEEKLKNILTKRFIITNETDDNIICLEANII